MKLRRAFLWLWISGLIAFGTVIALGLPLVLTEVPGGILDHQAAGTAAEVDRIQAAWRLAGLWRQALFAVAGDLVFIGLYGIGCVLAGLWFRRSRRQVLRFLGIVAIAAGGLFLVTDYAETISQFIQLWRFSGDDGLAGLAATVRPVKVVTFLIATGTVMLGLAVEWRGRRPA